MSTSQPPPETPTTAAAAAAAAPPPDLTSAYHTFQHYTALTFLLGAPILIALPPRKLDFYTFALGSSWVLGANHLYRERARARQTASPFGWGGAGVGVGVGAETGGNPSGGGKGVKEKKTRYEIVQEQLKREKEDANKQKKKRRPLLELPPSASSQLVEEETEGGRPKSGIERGLEKVWMGGEKAGWKERRLAEEQEKISQGEGYGGMIMDQIWEVWNWGKETENGEGVDGQDEEVSWERRRRRGGEEFPEIGKEKKGR